MELNKYSCKLINFIKQNIVNSDKLKDINISNIFTDIDNNKLIQLIQKLVKESDGVNILKLESEPKQLHQIHESTQYPLTYIIYHKMHELKLLEDSGQDLPDMDNFLEFVTWFRKNQHNDDISICSDKISKKILNSEDEELITMYSLMFKTEGPRSNLHKLIYDNPFVSLDIQHHAETTNMSYIKYDFEDNGMVHLYYVDKEHMPNIKLVMQVMILMRRLVENTSKMICSAPEITLFCGLQKKYLPSDTDNDLVLCPDNINSGCTIPGVSVMLWRFEEIVKVLIHELIHYYGLDFYIDDKNYVDTEKFINSNFCISPASIDRPNESYTETLAILIHSCLVSHHISCTLQDVLSIELMFGLFQITKILKFYKMDNMEEIYASNTNTCSKQITQYTSMLSYYIIKTSLLFNYKLFIDFVGNNSLKIKHKIPEFITLINKSMNNMDFINAVNTIREIVYENNKTSRFIINTMRMSCMQLN